MESAQPPASSERSAVPAQRPAPPTQPADLPPQPSRPGRPPSVPAQRTPPGPAVGDPVRPTQPRLGRLRLVLTVLGGMLALLCLGGVGVAYVFYDGATAPDRSAPDVVVDNYLRAYLVDRDDSQADLFVCEEAPNLDEIKALRAESERREAEFRVIVRISWGSLDASATDRGETVRTELTIAGFADGQSRSSRTETWLFDVVDRDGWRVCGAERIA